MSKFDCMFSEVLTFVPYGYYLSRNVFTKKEALNEFRNYLGAQDISLDEIKKSYVRWQPIPWELQGEIEGKMCWLVCGKNDRNAQPCWTYGD